MEHRGTELYARWLAVAQADVRAVAAYARLADPERSQGEAMSSSITASGFGWW